MRLKKRWFLKVELVVLVFVVCIWVVKSATIDIDSIKAGVLKQVVKINPNDAHTHLLLGNIYYDSNRPEEAILHYRKAIEIDPDNFDANLNLGDIYSGLGRYAGAIECFKQITRIKPDYAFAHTALGLVYYDSGRYEEAIEAYKQVIQSEPNIAGIHFLLGNSYAGVKNHQKAIESYEQAIRLDPTHTKARYALYKMYLEIEDKDSALYQCRITTETVAQDVADHTSGAMLTAESKRLLKQQEEQQRKNLDMELAHIDEYVLQQRQNIENWYASNVANLQRWGKERLDQLDGAEKAAWARFCQNMKNTMSNNTGYLTMDSYGYADTYFTGDGYATTNSYVMTDGYFSEKTNTFVVGNPAGRYESELNWIKNSKEAIKSEFIKLQQKRENYLAELEDYAQNKRAAIYATKRSIQKDTEIKLSGGPGMIQAICSDNEKPSIMLNGGFFYEGATVNGFKVLKIDFNRDRVEFEKNGKIWVQKLQ